MIGIIKIDWHYKVAAVMYMQGLKKMHFSREYSYTSHHFLCTGCPKINFTFLNVNNVRTNVRIATPALYIDRGDL